MVDAGYGQAVSFLDPIFIPTGTSTRYVEVEDVNQDAILDFITVGYSSDDVSIHLGQGDLNFALPVSYDAANGPSRMVTADFNADGFVDMAVTSATFA